MENVLERVRNVRKKRDRNSVYSMVSCSDLTPGSLEVWVDLPDTIKFDPVLAPFKQLYEQHHGKWIYLLLQIEYLQTSFLII